VPVPTRTVVSVRVSFLPLRTGRMLPWRRLTWVAAGVLLWAILIIAKLFSLQVLHHGEYLRLARQQQERQVEIPAPRGSMFDRTGNPLAMSVPVDSVYVNPLRLPDLAVASDILAKILDLDRTVLYGRLKQAFDGHRGFLWVKRRITPAESARLRSLGLSWIEFQQESQRHYPDGWIAGHVLGSVDHDERGNNGLELGLDKILRGRPGSEWMLTDVKGSGIDAQMSSEAHAGSNVSLSIDERIQFAAERELKAAVLKNRARTGSLIVMNPYTGEILAMANYPAFDPNEPPRSGEPLSARLNLAISSPFEPGSIFKVVTLSAALESTNLRPETMINCGNGTLHLPGRVVHEAKHGYGVLTMAQVLEKSSNIGAIQVGLRVGEQNMYDYVRRFGFGQQTGLPLPAESAGMLRKLKRWGSTSLASIAMGHEISTTSIQLARACSVIANGGLLVEPRLVLRRGGEPVASKAPKRIIRPETAITMRRIMEGVVLRGTGKGARLDGYTSGGKTGTAQIFDFATRHYTHLYNASFMGFAPVTNPAVVVVVTLIGTSGSAGYGGTVAAPVFRAVTTEALRVLEVPKDLPDVSPAEPEDTRQDLDDVAIAGLSTPDPAPTPDAGTAEQVADPEYQGPRVPDFQGKTMRAVAEQASSLGVTVLLDGSGIARVQSPAPGSPLHPGERIRVQFAR
jgi:cell division protein FtsI (penicillin-binding protein 3)